MTNPYTFTDNPTESGVAVCDTDILNDDIMYLKWELSNSPAANTDLSNLTSTGKTKVVTLAHELDWANVVTVATGNKGNTYISYTLPSDGMLYVYAKGGGTSSNAKFTYAYIANSDHSITYDSQLFAFGGSTGVSNSTAVAKYCGKSGEEVTYMCYVSGYATLTGAEVIFIPFKKSL